jgi:hypothetical protein
MKNSVKTLIKEVETVINFFDTYVASVKDRSGHELWDSAGGEDFSIEELRNAVDHVKGKLAK